MKFLTKVAFTSLLPVIFSVAAAAQQPTGKSYDSGPIKRPATTAPQYPSPVTFSDITAQTKIDFRHYASPTDQKFLIETMGAGVALIDFDGDGLLDIFFTNGAEISDPMPKDKAAEKTAPKYWDRLYRQKKDGTFEDVTEKAGVKGSGYSFGTAVGDYDRDGRADLFVTRFGGATLYRNKGDGTFEDVTRKLGIKVGGWANSTGFFDYDKDGRLDIFIARYADWNFENGKIYCGENRPGYRAYCHPDNFDPLPNILLHQKPDGTFEDVSEKAGIAESKGKALGVSFADFDDDGWTDVFVANDNMDQQLFRNEGKGTFEEIALPSGVAVDEKGKRFSGMGIDIADYDGDGRQDIVITTLSNETYPLYHNAGDWLFDYVTQITGIAQITILGAGWGIKFIDADNDGRRDVMVAQSHVLDTIEKTTSFLKYKQNPLLIRNTEKGFQNISFAAGDVFKSDLAARGMACGDLDNDGDTDIVIAQTDGPPVIIKNNGTKNHWIGLDLRGTESAPNGEGARVTVADAKGKKQFFDLTGAGSYLSANDLRLLVGLGESEAVKSVEIRWPGGQFQKMENPPIDRYHVIREPKRGEK
ncbi:MAG: CRTAC1 family protein [Pyrinomonadaceae bacterium]